MPPGNSVLAGRHCSLFVTIDVPHKGFTYIYDPAMYAPYTQNDLSASVAFTGDASVTDPVSYQWCHLWCGDDLPVSVFCHQWCVLDMISQLMTK